VPAEKITLTRNELYEKVWTKPMQKLAKEVGLSDVGLAKLCRRHEIPLPGRGYWVRIQFGKKPERSALPNIQDFRLDNIEIYRREPQMRKVLTLEEKEKIPAIEVTADRPITHPLVRRIEQSMDKSSKDERGMLGGKQGTVVPLRVSQHSLPRALRILDALFAAVDGAKYTVDWPKPYHAHLTIIALDERLTFSLSEAANQESHKPTKEEIAQEMQFSWKHPPKWDFTPNGCLRLSLRSCEDSYLSHSWKDGKRRKLEECVGEIFAALEGTAKEVKLGRQQRAEAAIRRAEEQQREAEASARQAEYDRKAEAVIKLAHAWEESKLIKEFAAALKLTLATAEISPGERQELEKMTDWSFRHANQVDPLTDLKWAVRQFKNPPWMWGYR
jgi:hypothetical protein